MQKNKIDYDDKYLSNQIITYLGNKRKLIKFIDKTVDNIIENDKNLSKKNIKDISFFDIFSGSGVVSRYSKLKGMKTYSNDLELYSAVIQDTIIGINSEEINELFKPIFENLKKEKLIDNNIEGKDYYQLVLDYLNSLENVKDAKNKYFQIHYAPKETNNPDFNNERLFYTQENAQKIDAIVEVIHNPKIFPLVKPYSVNKKNNEELYSNIFKEKFIYEKEKNIILSSLMYKMTVNINTSGTMKGFHNGWGGKEQNALSRIKGKIKLEKLPFVNGNKGITFNDYAEKVFSNNDLGEIDIIYADPPYNQHQYSANYNHLTTICRNDKYNPGPVVKGSRAGIRTDHTRSNFCKSTKDKELKIAEIAFMDFIEGVKAKYIIMSYNNEGVISIDRLMDLMSQNLKNSINVTYQLHDKFKGGKGTQTSNKVMEYLIIIEQNKKQSTEDYNKVKSDLLKNTEKKLFLDKYINLEELSKLPNYSLLIDKEKELIMLYKEKELIIKTNLRTLKVTEENISVLNEKEKKEIIKYELDNLQLINYYINKGYKKEAEKLLNVFKIKKYDNIRDDLINRINRI